MKRKTEPPVFEIANIFRCDFVNNQRASIIELPLMTRDMSYSGVNKQNRLVHFSFSSNTAARRQYGWEILSHDPGCCDVERIERGACPFLKGHDWTMQAGKVISCQLGGDKNYAVARLFTSALGEELLNEIAEGRTEISVGYIIKSMSLTQSSRDHEDDIYTVDHYEIIEISSVSVPMDITVGVCRSLSNQLYECRVMPSRSGPITPEDEREIQEEIRREYFEEKERERVKAIQDQADKLQYYLW
jgi:hypothetical protein